jgi:Tfp pilus assembly protein PilN
MNHLRLVSGSTDIGVAIGRRHVYACRLGDRRAASISPWVREFATPIDAAAVHGGLEEPFSGLREAFGAGGTAWVALLPPLVQARRVELPPLGMAELQRVLARDASRYFVGVREPQVVGAIRLGPARGRPMSVLAAAAAESLVEAVVEALARSGWAVGHVVPACAAWTAAARELWVPGGEPLRMVIAGDAYVELLHQRDGRAVGVRRMPSLDAARIDVSRVTDGLAADDRQHAEALVALVAAPESRAPLEAALGGRIASLRDPGTAPLAESPLLLAAWFAAGPELVPERLRVAQQRRASRLAALLAVAALLLLTAAAALHLWGLQRELDNVRASRAAIRADVDSVMELRMLLGEMHDRLDTIGDADRQRVPWALIVSDLARRLPRTSHLTAVRVEVDSIGLEGTGRSAGDVLGALRRSDWLTRVQPDGPIQQIVHDDQSPEERFFFGARIRSPVAQEMER